MIYFTADLHLNHENIIKYCNRPFNSVEEMNKTIIDNINTTVGQNDTLYILGDFCWGKRFETACDFLEKIECRNVKLLYGNHDQCIHLLNYKIDDYVKDYVRDPNSESMPLLSNYEWDIIDRIERRVEILGHYYELRLSNDHSKNLILMHYPMSEWNQSHRGSIQLYGHCHGKHPDPINKLQMDVGIDCWNFMPVSLDQVYNKIEYIKSLNHSFNIIESIINKIKGESENNGT